MKKISTEIVADSKDERGNRITSFLLTYPRFIHGELMTHRMFSRNSASSRAVPFDKMVKMVKDDPFIPIAWQKGHKGMQGTEYQTGEEVNYSVDIWLEARDNAIEHAKDINFGLFGVGLTKQLCNRLLEPFMWHTVLVTATEFDNFFTLRCPKYHYDLEDKYFNSKKDWLNHYRSNFNCSDFDLSEEDWRNINHSQAEIHIQALAESMWDAMNESTPRKLSECQWHIPFGDNIDYDFCLKYVRTYGRTINVPNIAIESQLSNLQIKIATARVARLSYANHDGELNYEKDIKLHDRLIESKHMSPMEHCARVMTQEEYYEHEKGKLTPKNSFDFNGDSTTFLVPSNNSKGWCNNFRGFIPYRYLIENE